MRRSTLLLLLALCLAGATALPAHGGAFTPEVLFTAKKRSITAPAVAGSSVAWISGPKGRPGECVEGRKRLQLLGAGGNVRVLTHRSGRNYETSCLFRPVLAGRFVMWSTPGREFIWARKRGRLRGWHACCGQNVEHHHDITRSGDVNWLLDPGPRYWPRWIGMDGQETPIWVDIDRITGEHTLMGSGLSVPLPDGFVGLDAAGSSIVGRLKSEAGYSLVSVDPTSGALTTLTTSSKLLSLPAVAHGNAAYLRREGNVERIELVEVASGDIAVIAERTGKPQWGKGQCVNAPTSREDDTPAVVVERAPVGDLPRGETGRWRAARRCS